jgi:hypothetical protein
LTKRSASKQPEQPVYFIDRSFGPKQDGDVVRILKASGMRVEAHDTHFPDAPPDDPVWLAFIARHGWIGITTDKQISLTEAETHAVMSNGVKLFICIGRSPYTKIAENIANSQHRMARYIRKHRDPFIARLYMANDDEMRRHRAGQVKVYLTYEEWIERQAEREAYRAEREQEGQ